TSCPVSATRSRRAAPVPGCAAHGGPRAERYSGAKTYFARKSLRAKLLRAINRMEFGIFSNGFRRHTSAAQTYDEDLAEIVLADELGFRDGGVTVHHTEC